MELRRMASQCKFWQKFSKTPSQHTNWEWWPPYVVPAMWDAYVRGSWFQTGPGKKRIPYLKINLKQNVWEYSSSNRAPAHQTQSPNFKTSALSKKKLLWREILKSSMTH
jgi:hypothetical protein